MKSVWMEAWGFEARRDAECSLSLSLSLNHRPTIAQDVKNHFNSAMGVLSANLPSGTAFTAAFIYGLRYG